MTARVFPQRVANDISVVLRTVLGNTRFPVDIKEVAREISAIKFPNDPITMIKGADLPGFEGCLTPDPTGKRGWGIIYNKQHTPGRINFTLGHEFGHYLLHRIKYPNGFQCSTEDMTNWASEYGRVERQANEFAAVLLMPLDDFRVQIPTIFRPSIDDLGKAAEKYAVSLIAATLRWLQYTSRCSVFVVSREGYILWARSSKSALKSGLYFKTHNRPPIEVPADSLACQGAGLSVQDSIRHTSPTWLQQPCLEHTLFSDQYDFTLSLLHFDNSVVSVAVDEESEEDLVERMQRQNFRRK